mgnify:CR=1 FL=1
MKFNNTTLSLYKYIEHDLLNRKDTEIQLLLNYFELKPTSNRETNIQILLPQLIPYLENMSDTMKQKESCDDADLTIQLFIDNKTCTECYDIDSIQEWMNNLSNYYANWIENETNESIDVMGYGGHAGAKTIMKTPYNHYVVGFSNLEKGEYIGIEIAKNVLVGNKKNIFGMNQEHGQTPGHRVFYIVPVKDTAKKTYQQLQSQNITFENYPTQRNDTEYYLNLTRNLNMVY